MDVIFFIVSVIIIVVLVVIGVGIGLFIWFKTRAKKKTWVAKCWQKSDGTIEHDRYKLKELVPFCLDRVERLEYEDSRVVYRLVSLNIPVIEVTADVVQNWGKIKEVDVLIENGQATIIKKGYDDELGKMIFKPLPTSTMQTVINQYNIKRKKVQQEKSFLASVMPFVAIALSLVALMACSYFVGDSFVKVATMSQDGQKYAVENMQNMTDKWTNAMKEINNQSLTKNVGKVYLNDPSVNNKPPSIE